MANPLRRSALATTFLALSLIALPVRGVWATEHHPLAMVVDFSIKDYDAWRPVFDAAAADRAKDGITNARVFRDADHPDHLVVIFDVTSTARATAWMKSATVRSAWQKGGVSGEPTYHFMK